MDEAKKEWKSKRIKEEQKKSLPVEMTENGLKIKIKDVLIFEYEWDESLYHLLKNTFQPLENVYTYRRGNHPYGVYYFVEFVFETNTIRFRINIKEKEGDIIIEEETSIRALGTDSYKNIDFFKLKSTSLQVLKHYLEKTVDSIEQLPYYRLRWLYKSKRVLSRSGLYKR